MAVLDQERVTRIKSILKWHPRGMTISEITRQLKMNRNLTAKYLDMLLISGQVEMQLIGAAKVYFLTKSVPVSAMLEFTSDLVIMIDPERKVLFMNEHAQDLFNKAHENLTGRSADEIVSPVLPGLSFELEAGSIPGSDSVSEHTCTVGGEVRHFRIKKIPTAFEDGTVGFTLLLEDITREKKDHQQLAISEARYRGIVTSSGEAIVGTDPQGRITSFNPAAERLFGYPEAEVTGRHLGSLVPPEGLYDIDAIFRGISGGDGLQKKELMMKGKSETPISTLITICPIHGENGTIVGTSSIIHDVTRERLEAQMRSREDQYREQVRDLKVGVYRSTGDLQGRFVWGNTALLDILGYPSMQELQNVKVSDLFSIPDARTGLLSELQQSGFVKNRILHLTRRDGKPITVNVTALAEFNEAKDLVFINGIVQDITGENDPPGARELRA